MKTNIIVSLIALAGLVTGIVAGRHFSATGTVEETVPRVKESAPESRKDSRSSASAAARSGKQGLAQVIRLVRNYHVLGDPETLREIERLDTPELRSLIEDLIRSRSHDASAENQAIGHLITAAIKEWYRRDGEVALRQAEEMSDGEMRRMILSQLINAAVYENPELGKQWADRFRSENGTNWYRSVVMEAVRGAIGRGADDFLEVNGLFEGEGVYLSGYGGFAEDFDFGKVIAAIPLESGVESLVAKWAVKDPEAAWEMAKKLVGEHGERAASYVSQVFQGISIVKGDEQAAAWLADHIGEVPESARWRVFQSLRSVEVLSPERSATVMAALTGKDERMLFASVLIDPHSDNGTGLAGLRALDSNATRVEALMATAKNYARGMGNGGEEHFNKVHGYFDRTMEELDLPAADRETVKAALAPPGNGDEP